jgi:hypothetical protein
MPSEALAKEGFVELGEHGDLLPVHKDAAAGGGEPVYLRDRPSANCD